MSQKGYSHLYSKLVEEEAAEPLLPHATSKAYDGKVKGRTVMLDNPESKKRLSKGRKGTSPGNVGLLRVNRELRKSELKYEQCKVMNDLWQGYIRDLLAGKPESQWAPALLKADYHGAIVRVEVSRTKSLKDMTGMILQETHNAYIIIQQSDDQLKIIPKRGTIFMLDLPSPMQDHSVRIFGDQMLVYSAHRATRKFKPKPNVFSL